MMYKSGYLQSGAEQWEKQQASGHGVDPD